MRKPFSTQLIKNTQEAWQPFNETPLTESDAQEILSNILALCDVLWKIETDKLGESK